MLLEGNNGSLQAYPDLLLVEAGVHGDLLPHAHVGVAVPLEERLQLLQYFCCLQLNNSILAMLLR